jgi:hypothetical protein
VIKSRRVRWGEYAASMGEMRNAYKNMVGRPERKMQFGTPRHRWEDNIKMDLREIRFGGVDWMNLAQERDW